ncbi:hypothetical protein [Sphingomonas phyllosphaerae]|uniref:hypothetical protein n=1 Tax=Sphingomonas phyllosphaerae TaxID=257003 RepID=UPI002413B682|nr:hypothetical protein [Sphingomonas phyllosphaerae]
MPLHYSAAANAFFDARLHDPLPDDAVPVTAAEHQALLAAQAAGKVIRPGDDGAPTARRPTETTDALRGRLLAAVKQEAARRILAVAPLWRQLNDVRDLAQAEGEGRAAIDRRCATVDALRAAFDRLEAALATMTPRQLARVDLTADSHWTEPTS